MGGYKGKLRREPSLNCSGKLYRENNIPILKECNYLIKEIELDGDAPKQFIKAYFFEEESGIKKDSRPSWPSYIAKTAEKWYPHESVIEYMLNRIGQELGVTMNEIKLVRASGQIRFLSEYFLKKDEKLVHGAEICGQHLGDMDMAKQIAEDAKTARELFTFQFIVDAIRSVFPDNFENLLADLVKMIGFDAVVGNNDRHFYNWGVVDTTRQTSKKPTFAPVYDSARGLHWNYSDEAIVAMNGEIGLRDRRVLSYLNGAVPRISIEENKEANHFELVDFIVRINTEYRQIIRNLVDEECEMRVMKMLQREFFPFFIRERSELITIILTNRFAKIRGIVT
jgi:HipA-like C-terminal domain